jgi:membrane protease YdiL (CAAX protease family)
MKQKILSILNKEDIITAGIIFLCLFLYVIFPTDGVFQQIISSATFLLVIPLLYVKIILKKDLSDFGIQRGEWKTGIFWSLLSLVTAFLILYVLYYYFDFFGKYDVPKSIRDNFLLFLGYQIFLTGFFTALYEFFFRGFVMFSFSEKFGYWAIILQSAIFFLLIWLSSSMSWSMAPYLIFAVLGGVVAFFSHSIIYSFISTSLFIIIIDSIFIKIIK